MGKPGEVFHKIEPMVNEYGSIYGHTYIVASEDDRWRLIREVIGEDHYYGSRDVWSQIEIVIQPELTSDGK